MAVIIDQVGDGAVQLVRTSEGRYSVWVRASNGEMMAVKGAYGQSYQNAVMIFNMVKAKYYSSIGRPYDPEEIGPSIYYDELGNLRNIVFIQKPEDEEKKALIRTVQRMHETDPKSGLPYI